MSFEETDSGATMQGGPQVGTTEAQAMEAENDDGAPALAYLQWVEKQAEGAMKQRVESANLIHQQATNLATLLVAGGGAALPYGLAAMARDGAMAWAALAAAAWLFAVLAWLLPRAVQAADFPLGYNEPDNLLPMHATGLRLVLWGELLNRQAALTDLNRRNTERSTAVNRARLAAAAVPVVFGTALLAARWLG